MEIDPSLWSVPEPALCSANFNYDSQGDSHINLATFNVSGSYNRIINSSNVISGGLLLGFSTRGFSETDLTWDSQWTGDSFDGGIVKLTLAKETVDNGQWFEYDLNSEV